MKNLSLNQQSALNIVGSIVVVVINALINLVLSPYIVENLGVEVNGYITLANNFVSYIALVTMALNSMAGRFILIDFRKGNIQSSNEYFSSVLLGDWILAMLFFIPILLFVIFIDRFINVPAEFLYDTKLLFGIVFLNYIVQLLMPQWQTATYCTNNLYLRSLKNAVSSIVRAVSIYLLFLLFTPHSYYVALAASLMSIVSISMDYTFCKRLMPELQWHISLFRISKVKELVSSGIWNTISQCGNLLLEGLDILIANIFINPLSSGILALSKIIPNMINQITGTVATTYGPRLTYLYADGKRDEMVYEVKNEIFVVSLLANVPIGLFLVYGSSFFRLWVPSQDANQLALLSSISLIGMLFSGISQCFVNIFGVVNKLKLNSIVVVCSGLINIICVYFLMFFIDMGMYAIVVSSLLITIIRIFGFTIPYSARLMNVSWTVFCMFELKGVLNVLIPVSAALLISYCIEIYDWFTLFICIGLSIIIVLFIYMSLLLDKRHKDILLKKIFRK